MFDKTIRILLALVSLTNTQICLQIDQENGFHLKCEISGEEKEMSERLGHQPCSVVNCLVNSPEA